MFPTVTKPLTVISIITSNIFFNFEHNENEQILLSCNYWIKCSIMMFLIIFHCTEIYRKYWGATSQLGGRCDQSIGWEVRPVNWVGGATSQLGGGCDQSIGSTVSDAIVRSWWWLTATRSSPLGSPATSTQTFPISKMGGWKHTTVFHKSSETNRHRMLKHL